LLCVHDGHARQIHDILHLHLFPPRGRESDPLGAKTWAKKAAPGGRG
ncbi:MAG: hypothetical protein ACI8UR_002476, partial [Natronomonas sp.]